MVRFAANLSFLFTEVEFPARFEAAARAGFKAVEFLFPEPHAPEDVKRWAAEAGVEIVLFNAAPGDWDGGERGIGALPGRESEFNEAVELALDTARILGVERLHVLGGIIPDGMEQDACLDTFAANLCIAASRFGAHGIEALVEPINPIDIPGYVINTPTDGLDMIRRAGCENLYLQFDLYHAAMQGLDVVAELNAALPFVRHVQVAGCPGRHEPGTGEVDFAPAFKLLETKGYAGWIGAEYRPLTSTEAGLGWFKTDR